MSLLNARELQPFLVPDVRATGNVLGNGSYGCVEEVEIPGATCVAKKLHEALLPPPTEAHGADRMSSLFVSECRLMSKLRHPNIVQFLGVCFLPGSRLPALLMEKLLTDLHNLLEENPGIPLSMKHSILVGVANGLVYLHNHDPPVIHRDLSARNVLLNSAMVAKIADLGNSRIVDVRHSQLMTMTKNPGNMWYMPPEAQGIVTKYSTSLDVFSFGNLMLFTLTQKFPEVKPAAHTDPNTGRVTGLTEIERRSESFIEITHELGREHPMVQLAERCLENLPKNRPPISEVARTLRDTEESVRDEYSHLSKLEMVQLHDREMKQKTSDSAVEPHQAETTPLKCDIETLQAKDKSQQDQIASLESQIRSLEEQLDTQHNHIVSLEELLDAQQSHIGSLEEQLSMQRKQEDPTLLQHSLEMQTKLQQKEKEESNKGRVSQAPGQKVEFKKQSVKYTAQKLHKKGVILEIVGLPNHQFRNVVFEITSTDVGMFEVSGSFFGKQIEKVELVFQDLLQVQYEGLAIMKMFGRAKFDVNQLIVLINKKFYGRT